MKKVCIIVAIFGIALGMIGCAKPTESVVNLPAPVEPEETIPSIETPEDVEKTIESLEDVK